jgi:uncharacterized protein
VTHRPETTSNSDRVLVAGDVHSHVWDPAHLSREFRDDLVRAWPEAATLDAGYAAHATHAAAARRSIVLAFDAEYAGFAVPDEFVSRYVAQDTTRLVGFCSVNPIRKDAFDRLDRAIEQLGLKGLKLAPTYQGFDPLGKDAFRFYERVADRNLPIVWHQGITFVRRSIMAYALPRQIDEVAIRFPELRIVIAHLGHPWISECIAVIRKHPSVYADISALSARPLQFERALTEVGEYRCAGKVLFGSDFPFGRIEAHAAQLQQWADSDDAPVALRETAAQILRTDPLEALGF